MRLTLVVGLPASGKTQWVLGNRERTTYFADDPRHVNQLPSEFRLKICGFDHVMIADPYFCDPQVRSEAHVRLRDLYPHVKKIDHVWFENNPEQCRKNAQGRSSQANGKVLGLIHALSQVYVIPEGAQVMPVYTPD